MPSELSQAAPTPAADRIVAMDVLRGFALFGIYVVNLPSFALTSDIAYSPQPGEPATDLLAWALMRGLCMTKFFTLFSILFGMGLVLQMERAERARRPFEGLYLRRLGALAVMGVLHGVFLFFGDILFIYSIAGFVLFLGRRWAPRTYASLAGILLAIGVTLSALVLPHLEALSASSSDVALELAAYQDGPYSMTLSVNALWYVSWLVASSVISFNWRVMAYFFAGAALMKLEIFHERRRGWYGKLLAIGLPLGLLLEGFALWNIRASGGHEGALPTIFASEVGSTLLSMGYLGGVLTIVRKGLFPRLQRGLAAAGRMALTNYIGQSVISCVLFRWYGFDLYAELSRGELFAVAILVFAFQLIASSLWLSRFRMGPLEWLWRKATY